MRCYFSKQLVLYNVDVLQLPIHDCCYLKFETSNQMSVPICVSEWGCCHGTHVTLMFQLIISHDDLVLKSFT